MDKISDNDIMSCSCTPDNNNRETLCGSWTSLAPMSTKRELFACTSGPDQNSTGTLTGVDDDPRVYVIGGRDENGNILDTAEKYNPDDNTWSPISPLPFPLYNCNASFAPDYGKNSATTLGYIYVAGGQTESPDAVSDAFLRYNIRDDLWDILPPLPEPVTNVALQYLDDFGGPLAELFVAITQVNLPACSDGKTLWLVGGNGTERKTWYIEINVQGETVGNWVRGPDMPLFRKNPIIGRTFWRDRGITSYGVSNCATIIVAGGQNAFNLPTKDVQLLIRGDNCDWKWITVQNNPSEIPDGLLKLTRPVYNGAFGTEQWPETLVTGGRPIIFGGEPPVGNAGSVQFAQFRFNEDLGQYQRDSCVSLDPNPNTEWNRTTSMPDNRINFRASPISQVNSSFFGGRRVSRFVCPGGRDSNGVTDRVQLFQLPVPSAFLVATKNLDRC